MLPMPGPTPCNNRDFTKERIKRKPELEEFLSDLQIGVLADCFNVLNPDFRHWWVDTVAEGCQGNRADGAFIDQMHGNRNLHENKSAEIERPWAR